ncbi:hypothetical protein BOW53_02945 [Solemya pervernicosa gill symbiont]|uniref:Uncharacterized protein n=1 Tax=Solemya pervernicosa gill symbiont TaxID=642797 RepID=A0A1T2L989_9GAMM|nr:hypothetical protein [Solemya pervernicosa gill symbiont]OOZ41651.1 hypothetical protein BOW53_02945 [Solemya pervernicosa gill symbiont]
MSSNKPDVRLVLVEWLDSRQPLGQWQYLSEFDEPEATPCVSVGFLIHEGASVVALAPNMADINDERSIQASGVIRIPTTCVTRICELSEID